MRDSNLRMVDSKNNAVYPTWLLCQLEALAFAFPTTVLMLMTLGLLELAAKLPPEDLSYRHVWAFLPVRYFAGLALAWRRYR